MHISSGGSGKLLRRVLDDPLPGSTEAADDCSVADVLVNSWVRMARYHSSGLPTTQATRRELEFKTHDQVALKGYSYSPPSQESETAAKHFILLLQEAHRRRRSWPRLQVVWRSLQSGAFVRVSRICPKAPSIQPRRRFKETSTQSSIAF